MDHGSDMRGFYRCRMTPGDACMLLLLLLCCGKGGKNDFRDCLECVGTESADQGQTDISNAVKCL